MTAGPPPRDAVLAAVTATCRPENRGHVSEHATLAGLGLDSLDRITLAVAVEEARTRLLLGQMLRRAGHRTHARRELETACAMFLKLGTPIQERQARTELDSIGGRRRLEYELTPVEQRIADLVAAGQTNREVAAATFTSVRTVESHLGRIYRKLGIRSRTELAARPWA